MGHKKAADQPGHAKPKPGADNNTRLEFLEESVSALAVAIAAAGIELEADQDPILQAIAVVDRWHGLTLARAQLAIAVAAAVGVGIEEVTDPLAAAEVALGTMKTRITELEDAAKAGPTDATAGEIAAIARADAAEAALDHANGIVDELRKSIADALADGSGQDPEAEPVPVDRAAIECGPDAPRLSTDDLRVLVDEGADFALVFSDGTHEIVAIGPVDLPSRNLHRHAGRYVVAETITIKGLTASETIDGAALFMNGEQVQYCRFDPAHVINPGEVHQFNRAIAFG